VQTIEKDKLRFSPEPFHPFFRAKGLEEVEQGGSQPALAGQLRLMAQLLENFNSACRAGGPWKPTFLLA
jgi:hypothetical protein